MTDLAHQIATRAVGGSVAVISTRNPSDGAIQFAVIYESRSARWQSRHRFEDAGQADAGALVLGEFLGAEVRR